MKRLLLGISVLFAVSALKADNMKEVAAYPNVKDLKFENLWINSTKAGNYVKVGGASDDCRGMDGRDGILYFCCRSTLTPEAGRILLYDTQTGNFMREIALPVETFRANPDLPAYVTFPSNDIHFDNAGNIVLGNLSSDLNKGQFQVWVVNLNSDKTAVTESKKLLDFSGGGTLTGPTLRIDAFNIYGDMKGNGYILAAIAGAAVGAGDMVLRWDVANGVVNPVFKAIQLKETVPANLMNGAAPRVTPVSETLFYVDGDQTYASLYDMDGNLQDGFKGFSTSDPLMPKSPGQNGAREFSLTDYSNAQRNFLIYSYSNTLTATMPSAFALAEFGPYSSFQGMSLVQSFPASGMGSIGSNGNRTSVSYIEKSNNDKEANIYVYSFANGMGAYKLSALAPTGISSNEASAITITNQKDNIVVSEEVATIEVYTVTGQKLAQKANTSSVSATFASGIYIVKVMDKAGKAKTQKIVVE